MRRCLIYGFVALIMCVAAPPALAGEGFELSTTISISPTAPPSIDEAALTYTGDFWSVSAGRLDLRFGPGVFGQMVVGPVTGVNGLKYEISLGPVDWVQFWADLDGAPDRRLFGHRVQYRFDTLTLGISETAVLAGSIHPAYWSPLPVPYLMLQYLLHHIGVPIYNRDMNGVIGLDAFWHPYDDVEVYAELLVDDIAFTPPAGAPTRTGGMAGVAYTGFPNRGELRAEYVRINRFTYCHFGDDTEYVYQGSAIGHWLGPDADSLILQYSWRPSDPLGLAGRLDLARHGEGGLGDIWTKEDGTAPVILTGEVEWSATLRASAAYQLSPYATVSGYLEGGAAYTATREDGDMVIRWKGGAGFSLQCRF